MKNVPIQDTIIKNVLKISTPSLRLSLNLIQIEKKL